MQSRGSRTTRPPERPASMKVNRGGIQKRGATPLKVDKDGDLDMSGTESKNNKIQRSVRSGRGTAVRGSVQAPRNLQNGKPNFPSKTRPTKAGVATAVVQKAVFKEMGVKDPAQGIRSLRSRTNAHNIDSLEKVRVTGLKQSKAASNQDGGVSDLIAFLERKATRGEEEPLKIKKSRLEGDVLNVFVRKADVPRLLTVNNYTFAGTSIKVQDDYVDKPAASDTPKPESQNTIELLKGVLDRRYNPDAKLLDLSSLGSDPELVNIGMFDSATRESKFFPALMKVCDSQFKSAKDKEAAVFSVSLARNALPSIAAVSALSQTFPAIRNLDLSENQLSDLKSIVAWRWKFRQLDQLLLLNNPISTNEPGLTQELLKWYPELTKLDNVEVRSPEAIQAKKSSQLPAPILPPSFQDEGAVGADFVKQFFPMFDSDRNALVEAFYDSQSSFSYSVNTIAPRAKEVVDAERPTKWDQHIRRSRNLTRITNVSARKERLYVGRERILECFREMPASKHPDLLGEGSKWCIECNALPSLPDFTGQIPSGVGGLMIIVHGELKEPTAGNTATTTRSFDRTFILGPGSGVSGVRIICDTLVLRPYGGSDAWVQTLVQPNNPQNPSDLGPSQPQFPVPDGFATPGPSKTDEQVQKEILTLELSRETRMTLEYSAMCLEPSGWNIESARKAFEQAKANLPADAFIR